MITPKETFKTFKTWCKSVALGNKKHILSFYAEDGQLKGTIWDRIVLSHKERNNYFTDFLHEKENIKVTIDNQPLVTQNTNAIRIEGLYTLLFQ